MRNLWFRNSCRASGKWPAYAALCPDWRLGLALFPCKGGVYLWRNTEAARHARDAAWLERDRRTHGSGPAVQYFETPLLADNALGQTITDGEHAEA